MAPFIISRRQPGPTAQIDGVLVVNELLTALMLLAQLRQSRNTGVLVLGCGYVFSAAMALLHMLTFPGAFTPQGLLGADPQRKTEVDGVQTVELGKGDTVELHPGVWHAFSTSSTEVTRLLGVHLSSERIVNYKPGVKTDARGFRVSDDTSVVDTSSGG